MSLSSQEFDRGGLGTNHFEYWTHLWMSRNPSTTPSTIRTFRSIVAPPSRSSGLEAGWSDDLRLVVDHCSIRGRIRFFLKKFGGVSPRMDLSVNVPRWSNRSGGASPSATQHSQTHVRKIDHRDRRFIWFKTERVGFEPTVPVKTRWFSRPEP